MAKTNVLVFPCGAENAIVVHNALKYNVNFEVFGASSKDDHGKYVFRNYIGGIPFIGDDNFIDEFNRVLAENRISIVFPSHDTVSLFLAENREKINARIAVPDVETARICRDKSLTYDLFRNYGFCPEIYGWEEKPPFPVFIKPKFGEGGKRTSVIYSEEELSHYRKEQDDFLLVELLTGEEITVDCFTDRHGKLRFSGPRTRSRVFGGISVNSKTLPLTDEIENIAGAINSELNLRGLWFFQLKKDKTGKYKLLEVSVRTSSTMILYSSLGVNFHLLTAYDLMDIDVRILKNDYDAEIDRALSNSFSLSLNFDTVNIDIDDTITKKHEVNEFVMMFLYQMVRKKKRIILITRHEFDIFETLEKLYIDKRIFDEIKTLAPHQRKSEAIDQPGNAVFIDNAYQERIEVKSKLNMPVFDVDAIQSLIDRRE